MFEATPDWLDGKKKSSPQFVHGLFDELVRCLNGDRPVSDTTNGVRRWGNAVNAESITGTTKTDNMNAKNGGTWVSNSCKAATNIELIADAGLTAATLTSTMSSIDLEL